jgi:hypothetical protein
MIAMNVRLIPLMMIALTIRNASSDA